MGLYAVPGVQVVEYLVCSRGPYATRVILLRVASCILAMSLISNYSVVILGCVKFRPLLEVQLCCWGSCSFNLFRYVFYFFSRVFDLVV